MRICIDAGHYGKYNRSPVVKTYYESDMAWKLHLYLKTELEKLGANVVTTRADKNKDMNLVARGQKATGCDLFISLHSNASGTESADYPLALVTGDNKALKLGKLLADSIASLMGTKQDGVAKNQLVTKKDKKGKVISSIEYYGVLRGARSVNVPGIILEHGFHTNMKSSIWLSSDTNLKALAKAEAKIIFAFFNKGGNDMTKVAPRQTRLNGQLAILSKSITVAEIGGLPLKTYNNSLGGTFTYPRAVKTCSILVSAGVIKGYYSCHYATKDGRGNTMYAPETVLYKLKDGTVGVKRCELSNNLPDNVHTAIGGMGLLDMYNPNLEGFVGAYSDVLRRTNHNVLLYLPNGEFALVLCKDMTGAQVNEYAKSAGAKYAIMLDGGGLAAIHCNSFSFNANLKQGVIVQAISYNEGVQIKPTESVEPKGPIYRVQVGAFRDKNNATKISSDLKKKGYDSIIVEKE